MRVSELIDLLALHDQNAEIEIVPDTADSTTTGIGFVLALGFPSRVLIVQKVDQKV